MAEKTFTEYIDSFDEADSNKDGRLNFSEVARFLWKKHNIPANDAYKIFETSDTNLDFYLSREEFEAAIKNNISPSKTREYVLRGLFEKFDSNNSGSISMAEARTLPPDASRGILSREKFMALMEGVKDDESKSVNYEEFLQILNMETAKEEFIEVFKKLDLDNNGTVTVAEMSEAIKKNMDLNDHATTIQGIIEECGTDADGKLTYADFLSAWDKQKGNFRTTRML